MRGLFVGYGATAMRDAPFAGIYVFFYENLKTIFKNNDNGTVNNPTIVNMSAGILI